MKLLPILLLAFVLSLGVACSSEPSVPAPAATRPPIPVTTAKAPTVVPKATIEKGPGSTAIPEPTRVQTATKNSPPTGRQKPKPKKVESTETEHQFIHIRDCQGPGGPIVDLLYIARFCSIDDALGFIENHGVKRPVLVIDAGRYSLERTIDREVEFRASDELGPSERVVITPPSIVSGHDCCTLRVIMQKSDDELVLDGLRITVRFGLPALSVSSGKISAANTTFSGSIVLQGRASVGKLSDLSVSGPIYTEDYKPEDTSSQLGIPTLDQCRSSGIAVLAGAVLEGSRVTISGASPLGICVSDTDSTAILINSSIVDTMYINPWFAFGWGGFVGNGGELRLVGSTVRNTSLAGLVVNGAGSHLTLSDGSTVSDVDCRYCGMVKMIYEHTVGILAQNGGEVTLLESEVTRIARGVGLVVSSGGTASVTDVVFDENGFAGVAVINGTLRMIRGRVVNTTGARGSLRGGVGILAQSDLGGVSDVFIEDSIIARNFYPGFWLNGGGGSTTIVGTTFRDNAHGIEETPGWNSGDGIHAGCHGYYQITCPVQRVTATDFILTRNRFSRTASKALNPPTVRLKPVSGDPYTHVFLDGSNATLTGNSYVGGTVDVHQQRCSSTTTVDLSNDGAIKNNLCPRFDEVTRKPWFSFIWLDTPILG